MYQITENLATHGLGETTYPQPLMDNQTGESITFVDDSWIICDVRFMKDEPQDLAIYKAAILLAGQMMFHSWGSSSRVLICCGAGQSRSNAIAIGCLVAYEKMDFYDAYNLVHEKVPIAQVEPCHINTLKKIFGVTLP